MRGITRGCARAVGARVVAADHGNAFRRGETRRRLPAAARIEARITRGISAREPTGASAPATASASARDGAARGSARCGGARRDRVELLHPGRVRGLAGRCACRIATCVRAVEEVGAVLVREAGIRVGAAARIETRIAGRVAAPEAAGARPGSGAAAATAASAGGAASRLDARAQRLENRGPRRISRCNSSHRDTRRRSYHPSKDRTWSLPIARRAFRCSSWPLVGQRGS
jgi:hypothetical protein